MKKLMHIVFLSCLKATELIEKKIRFSLSRKEKMQLTVHKMMCTACSRYEKQSMFIEDGLTRALSQEAPLIEDVQQLKIDISKKLADLK